MTRLAVLHKRKLVVAEVFRLESWAPQDKALSARRHKNGFGTAREVRMSGAKEVAVVDNSVQLVAKPAGVGSAP
jgi:hypothetical protein